MQYCQVSTLVGDDLRTIRINNVTRVFLDLTRISSCALGNGIVTFFVVGSVLMLLFVSKQRLLLKKQSVLCMLRLGGKSWANAHRLWFKETNR